MGEMKARKQMTHVILKDGRVLVSEASPVDIYNHLSSNSHIMIEGELHSKFSIQSAKVIDVDNLESFILVQEKTTQQKLRKKQQRITENMPNPMTLEYAKNYVKEHCQ